MFNFQSYGLSQPAIRRLRSAFADKELQKKIEKRIKKKTETKYVDVSNIEEYKPHDHLRVHSDRDRVSSSSHLRSEDADSPCPSPTPLALILKDDVRLHKLIPISVQF